MVPRAEHMGWVQPWELLPDEYSFHLSRKLLSKGGWPIAGWAGKASFVPLPGELQLQQCRPFIEQKLAQFYLKVTALPPQSQRKNRSRWNENQKKRKSFHLWKSWAVRMPDRMIWKPQSIRRRQLLKMSISLCSTAFGAKSQERNKRQRPIRSIVLGILLI